MRIDDRNLTGVSAGIGGLAGAQEVAKSGRDAAGVSGGSGSGDRVEISSTLAGLSRAMASDGNARASRVQALARSYQSGRYQPDAAATSRGMVSEALAGE